MQSLLLIVLHLLLPPALIWMGFAQANIPPISCFAFLVCFDCYKYLYILCGKLNLSESIKLKHGDAYNRCLVDD